ncbi:hypothetical protein ABVT39_024430 [Epinephelus coioides]
MLVCNISQQNYTTHKATLLPVARDFYACDTRVVSNLRLDIVIAQFVIRRKLFNYLKMSYLRAWRKRKREMEQLLRDSDSDEGLLGEDTSDCEDVPQTQSSSSGDHMPRSQSISSSDSGPEPLDWSDFDTDKEYWSTDSDTEQHDEGHGGVSFEEDLRQWAVHNKTTHRSLNELLLILRKQGHLLPLDARTLLATPQRNTTEDKCGGQYAYYGLEKGICRFLGQAEAKDVNLIVNIDGIPFFKSSGVQFWPILAKLEHSDPFIVAIFCGQSKPSPLQDYLKDFLTEYKHLQNNGLIYKGQTYNVHVKALVCDAPARAYLKCIKGHNSYEGCERCTVRGAQVERRMVFNDLESTPRTDEAFSRMEYANHQTSLSPLIAAGIPCVSSCALDYMHMVILGVCEQYTLTSHAEEEDEDEEEEVVMRGRRKPSKRKFEDFVQLGSDNQATVTQMEPSNSEESTPDDSSESGHRDLLSISEDLADLFSHEFEQSTPRSSRHPSLVPLPRHTAKSTPSKYTLTDLFGMSYVCTNYNCSSKLPDFPRPMERGTEKATPMYQRRVLNLLIDIRSEVRRIGQGEMASSSAPSARVETMDTMEDFQRQEQRLTDEEAFNALVNSIRLAKIS